MKIKQTPGDWMFGAVSYLVVAFLMLITLYPIWYVAVASISDPLAVSQSGGLLLWPTGIQFEGYSRVFANREIWTGYANTIFYTVVATALNVVLTSGLAFTLSRKNLMMKKPITMFVMFTMFFNGGMIPTYLNMQGLGLLNTRFAVLLPGLVSVYNMIIMRTNFEALPASLEESAKMDGASDWTVLWRIVLPLSMPTIAVMVLFYGVGHWSSWFNEMLYLQNRELWPLQLIIREILVLSSSSAMNDGSGLSVEMVEIIKYSTIMVSTIPILCVYPFLQKYFVKGVMVGAVKG